jgi:hypothetical protein
MRCPYCGAEKELRVWTCAECGFHIQKPPKPSYQAGGWEWLAALACSLVVAAIPSSNPEILSDELTRLTAFVGAVAFSFSAFRGQRRFAIVVGSLCLAYWTVFTLGVPLIYCAIILLIEHVGWRVRVARM